MANEVKLRLAIEGGQTVTSTIDGVTNHIDKLDARAREAATGATNLKGALGQIGGTGAGISSEITSISAKLAGLAASFATVISIGGNLVSVQREFDVLNSSLTTVTGSGAKAAQEFAWIKQFAATTPYQLNEVTQGFVKMKALGLDASQAALTSYGNTASAMGKGLNQMIEAVADASTGEFERLKEFGIKASTQGDQVALTFQGVTTTIGNSSKEITEYLESIGRVQFAGAMEERAKTLDGALSNLADNWEELFRTINQGGFGSAVTNDVKSLNTELQGLNDTMLNSQKAGEGMVMQMANAAGFAVGTAAVGLLNGSANILNSTVNMLTGGFFELNENVKLLPESLMTNEQRAAALTGKLQDAEANLAKLQQQLSAVPDNIYLKDSTYQAYLLVQQLRAAKEAQDKLSNGAQTSQSESRIKASNAYAEQEQKNQQKINDLMTKSSGISDAYIKRAKEIQEANAGGAMTAGQLATALDGLHGMLKKNTAGNAAAKKEASDYAKELDAQTDTLAKLSGYNKDYEDQARRLVAMREKGTLTEEGYVRAINELVTAQPGMIALTKAQAEASENSAKADIKAFVAMNDLRLASEKQVTQAATTLAQIEFETTLLAMNTEQRAQATMERELERQGIIKGTAAYDAYITKLREAMAIKTGTEAGIKATEDLAKASQKAAEASEKYWEDALMRAFEAGKGFFESLWGTIKNTLKTQVPKVLVTGTLSSFGLSGATAADGSASGGSDIVGMASKAWDMMTGGINDSIAKGFAKVATSSFGQSLGLSQQSITGLGGAEKISTSLTKMGQSVQTGMQAVGGALAAYGIQKTISGGYNTEHGGIIDAATAIAGAVFPQFAPVIGAAVGAFNRLFGSSEWKTLGQGVRGTLSATGSFSGETYQNLHRDVGFFSRSDSDRTNLSAVTTAQSNYISDVFTGVKVQTALFADAVGKSSDTIKDYTKTIDVALTDDAKANKEAFDKVFTDMADEMASRIMGLATDTITPAVAGYFETVNQYVKDGFAGDAGGSMVDTQVWVEAKDAVVSTTYAVSEFAKIMEDGSTESPSEVLSRLATSLISVNAILETLGYTSDGAGTALMESSMIGANAASVLIDAFGGVENMAAATSSYFDHFYTEEEKRLESIKRINTGINGTSEPVAGGWDAANMTREQFRALAESLNLTTEAGGTAYARLMSVEGAFYDLTEVAKPVASSIAGTTEAIENQANWQDKLNIATESTTSREVEKAAALKAADDATDTLINSLYALEDAAALESRKKSIVDKYTPMTLEGAKSALPTGFADAFATMGSEAAKQWVSSYVTKLSTPGDIKQVEDLTNALDTLFAGMEASEARLKGLSDESANLSIELLTAKGDVAGAAKALRELETKGFNAAELAAYDYNKSLRNQITAINDAKAALESFNTAAASIRASQDTIAGTSPIDAAQRELNLSLNTLNAMMKKRPDVVTTTAATSGSAAVGFFEMFPDALAYLKNFATTQAADFNAYVGANAKLIGQSLDSPAWANELYDLISTNGDETLRAMGEGWIDPDINGIVKAAVAATAATTTITAGGINSAFVPFTDEQARTIGAAIAAGTVSAADYTPAQIAAFTTFMGNAATLTTAQNTAATASTAEATKTADAIQAITDGLTKEGKSLNIALLEAQGDMTGAAAAAKALATEGMNPLQIGLLEANELVKKQTATLVQHNTLQDELNSLRDTEAQALTRQRDALDESNRALFDQVQGFKSLKSLRETFAVPQTATQAGAAVSAAGYNVNGLDTAGIASYITGILNAPGMLDASGDLTAAGLATVATLNGLTGSLKTLGTAGDKAAEKEKTIAATKQGLQDQLNVLNKNLTQTQVDRANIEAKLILETDATTAAMQKMVWGLQDIQSAVATQGSIFDKLATDPQKQARAKTNVNSVFAGLGIDVPATAADFLALSESANTQTAAGQNLVSVLSTVVDDFGLLHTATKDIAQDYNRAMLDAAGNTTGLAAFDKAISDAALITAGWTQAQIDAVDATRQATKTATATQDYNRALLEASGNKTGLKAFDRAIETSARLLAGWTPQQISHLNSVIDAAENVATAMTTVDAALATLGRAIDAQKTSIREAADAQIKAIEDSNTAAIKALEDQTTANSKARDEADKLASSLTGMVDSINSAIDTLRSATAGDAMTLLAARAYVDMSLSLARAGTMPDADKLGKALGTITADTPDNYATAQAYKIAQAVQAGKLDELGALAGHQLSNAEKQVLALEEANKLAASQIESLNAASDLQIKTIQDEADRQIKALDKQLKTAQDQVSVLQGIDISVISVGAAIGGLSTAVAGYAAAVWAQSAAQSASTQAAIDAAALAGATAQTAAQSGGTSWQTTDPSTGGGTGGGSSWSFATGTNNVPFNMQANIHKGERIIPAADNTLLMQRLNQPADNSIKVERLEKLLEAVILELAKTREQASATAASTKKLASQFEAVTEGGNAMLTTV